MKHPQKKTIPSSTEPYSPTGTNTSGENGNLLNGTVSLASFELFQSLQEAVVITNDEGAILFINSTAESLTGYSLASVLGQPIESVFALALPGERDPLESPVREALRSKRSVTLQQDVELLSPLRTDRPESQCVKAIYNRTENEVQVILLFRESSRESMKNRTGVDPHLETEKLKTELHDLQIQQSLLINSMPIYIYAEDVNDNFKLVFCNDVCAKLWRQPVSEVLGKEDHELFDVEEEVRRFRETDLAAVESRELREDIMPFTGADGKRHIGRFYRKLIELSGGRRWLFAMMVDITREYQQRERLNTARNVFEYAFVLSKSAIFLLNPQTYKLEGGNSLGALWPIFDEKALPFTEFVFEEDREKFSNEFKALLTEKKGSIKIEYRSTWFGEMRHYRLMAGLYTQYDAPPKITGIIQEITDEVKQASKLQKTLQLQDLIVNSIPSVLYVKDPDNDFRYLLGNRAMEIFQNISSDEIAGKQDSELFDNKMASLFYESDLRTMESPNGISYEEHILRDHMNRDVVLKTTKKIFSGINGERLLLGIGNDITDQYELLRNQTAMNDCLLDLLKDSKSNNDGLSPVLKVLKTRLGASHNDLFRFNHEEGVFILDNTTFPDSLSKKKSAFTIPFSTKDLAFLQLSRGEIVSVPDTSDHKRIRDLGIIEEKLHYLNAKSIYFAPVFVEEKLWGFHRIAYNEKTHVLTKHEKAFLLASAPLAGLMIERTLARHQFDVMRDEEKALISLMQIGARMTQSVFFKWAPSTMEFHGTPGLDRLMPVRDGRIAPFEEWISSEDLPRVWKAIDALRNGAPEENIHFHSDYFGKRRYYHILLSHDKTKGKDYFIGAIQDITEITHNAAKLKSSQEMWEKVVNTISSIFFIKDPNNNYRYLLCNQAFADFAGMTVDEIKGKTDLEIFKSKEKAALILERNRQVQAKKDSMLFELNVDDAHGQNHTLRSRVIPVTGSEGKHLLAGVCDDITELTSIIRHEKINSEILRFMVSESDFGVILDKIHKTLLKNLHCDRVLSLKLDKKNEEFLLVLDSHQNILDPVRYQQIYLELSRVSLALATDPTPLFFESLSSSPHLKKIQIDHPEFQNHSFGVAPIFIDNELVGGLVVSYLHKYHFTETDKRLLQSMANIIVLALIHERQRLAIKKIEIQNQLVLDNIQIPLALYDRNGSMVRYNKSTCAIFGVNEISQAPYACKDLLNCRYTEKFCPLTQTITDGNPHQQFISYKGHDYRTEVCPLKNEGGEVTHFILSAIDITKLNRLNKNGRILNDCLTTLIREKDIQRAIEIALSRIGKHLGATRCYILSFNTTTKTTTCFSEYSCKGKDNLFGNIKNHPYQATRSWEDIFDTSVLLSFPDLQDNIDELGLHGWKKTIDDNDIRSFYACRIILNNKFWGFVGLLYESERHELNNDDLNFLISCAHCIEAMLISKQNQDQIFAAMERVQAADRAKSIFLASMSHELRTPLNAVIGFSELLKDDSLSESDRKDYIMGLEKSGNVLLELINDVLDLTKLEAGQMVFVPIETHLVELLEETHSIFGAISEAKGVQLLFEGPEKFPTLWIDTLRIRQVLFNLVGNAVKFTNKGSITIRYYFEPDTEEYGTLSIHVIDTGIGVSPKDQERLFEMFVQANTLLETEVSHRGSGLGLTICKRMIEKMKGNIGLTSQLGKGSDFSFSLPFVRYRYEDTTKLLKQKNGLTEPIQLPSLSVLLVDDVMMNLKVGAALLKKLGMSVVVAKNAAEALELLSNSFFDFILTDLWMPGMNGYELAYKIRHSGLWPNMKIAAFTADVESNKNFDLSIFDAVLTKPITINKLTRFLEDIHSKMKK